MKNSKNNTQEEECCTEAFEENLPPDRKRFSNRLIYTILKSPLALPERLAEHGLSGGMAVRQMGRVRSKALSW